jgi:hypothetical protein
MLVLGMPDDGARDKEAERLSWQVHFRPRSPRWDKVWETFLGRSDTSAPLPPHVLPKEESLRTFWVSGLG